MTLSCRSAGRTDIFARASEATAPPGTDARWGLFIPILRLMLASIILVAISLFRGLAEPDGTTWQYVAGKGYVITHRVTHPGTVAGTQITVQATARWLSADGTQVGESVSEPLTITVAAETRVREWTYSLPPQLQAVLDSGSGEGSLSISGGTLTVRVNAPNDGLQHTFSWRMELRH